MVAEADPSLPKFTREELKKYNGHDGQPIYIGVANKVFDCTYVLGFLLHPPYLTHQRLHHICLLIEPHFSNFSSTYYSDDPSQSHACLLRFTGLVSDSMALVARTPCLLEGISVVRLVSSALTRNILITGT
jgi:hypothetical protein